jgi:hypothetical protein
MHPAKVQAATRHRGAQSAREVRAALAPVETLTRECPSLSAGFLHIDA